MGIVARKNMTQVQMMRTIMTRTEKDIFMEGYADALNGRLMNPKRENDPNYRKGYEAVPVEERG